MPYARQLSSKELAVFAAKTVLAKGHPKLITAKLVFHSYAAQRCTEWA